MAHFIRRVRLSVGVVLGITLLGSTIHAKKYIVTMKNEQAFERVYQQIQKATMSIERSISMMGTKVREVKSLKHLDMFIVESSDVALTMKNNPDVYSVKEDVIFQGVDPNDMYHTDMYNTGLIPIVYGDKDRVATPLELTWGQRAIHVQGAWTHTRGEGARVLVMDTGVDKDHPEFQESFEKGKSFYELEIAPPPGLPYEYYDDHGHGTHTAGTVLGQSVGVAPGAKLLSAKVCNGSGSCSLAGMYASIDWGMTEGVDVISISIGGPYGGEEERKVYEKVEAAGIVVVASSGNSGISEIKYPARFPTVIGVGAVDEDLNKALFSQYGPHLSLVAPGVAIQSSLPGMGVSAEVKIDMDQGFEEVNHMVGIGSGFTEKVLEADLAYAGLGGERDVADLDLTGKIALVTRGELVFSKKVKNALGKGAVAVIIHNNAPGLIAPFIDQEKRVDIPVIFIEQDLGEGLKEKLAAKAVVRASISTSLVPAYQNMDGTSMSCPHVAGVAALVISANTDLDQIEVRDVILSTTTDLPDANLFGAGLVNAEVAVIEAMGRKISSLPIAN